MRQFYLSALAFISILSIMSAQSVDYTQHTLISKRTASWCSNCGTWGWDAFEGILTDFETNPAGLAVAVHSSGDYVNETSMFFADYIQGFGHPQFFYNNTNLGFSRSNGDAKRQELVDLVNTTAMSDSPVGMHVEALTDGTELTVTTDYDTDGRSYRLGVYLLDNDLIGPQATRGDNAQHKRMLIGHLTPAVEGIALNGENGSEAVTTTLANWQIDSIDNYQVLVVVWDVTDGLEFANGRIADIQSATVNTNEVAIMDLNYRVDQTTIHASWSDEDVRAVYLLSQDGRLVASQATSNRNQVQFATPDRGGLYILSFTTSQGRYSEQIVVTH